MMNAVPKLQARPTPWKVLVVDDEPEVHTVTRLVLGNFRFEGRALEFLSAYSSEEARRVLRDRADVAVMLLDVVMETERAGLDLVRFVRQTLNNHFIRIVLRTGQPGQAPEHEVIADYDINDYKEKTELTAQKLSTTLYASLRAYRDILTIDAHKRGLERVIGASAHVFSRQHTQEFASAVLTQLTQLIGVERGALYCRVERHGDGPPPAFEVAAAAGEFERYLGQPPDQRLPTPVVDSLREAYRLRSHRFHRDHYVLHFTDPRDTETLLYVGEAWDLGELDCKLVEVFCTNVSIAFDNLHLNRELVETQLEMICLLAGAAETRSRETANHVKRVGLIAGFLAREYGLDDTFAENMRLAAPLHDIGKIGIPDEILNKRGRHTPDEMRIMQTHAELGHQMLAASKRPILQLAAEIALSHHENWDGSGYPRGLAGEAIPVSGRITMLADVYDALGSARCYKDAWPSDAIRRFLGEQRGRKFDPRLLDILLAHWDAVEAIRTRLPD